MSSLAFAAGRAGNQLGPGRQRRPSATHVVVPVLTELAAIDRPPPTAPSPLVSAWRSFDAELAKMARALAKAA